MNTDTFVLTISGEEVDVVRKSIKNLHLSVYPPTGRVRVAVPTHISDDAVRLAVVTRLPWIRRQQRSFLSQARVGPREFLTGESMYFEGRRYRLDVVTGPGAHVRIRSKRVIELMTRPGATLRAREAAVEAWLRQELRERVGCLILRWEPVLGVTVREARISKMVRKWGTSNPSQGVIRLNLDLMRLPATAIEYVVVHEMTHLLERNHGDRFQQLMDGFLPTWRSVREAMADVPLVDSKAAGIDR